jgi:UDP:flavonoid glycosyltransferase YjiC (YdhE family)
VREAGCVARLAVMALGALAYGDGVRVLLGCSLGGRGHLTPLVAVTRALRRLGHQSLVLVPPSLASAAREVGIAFRIGEEPPSNEADAVWDRVRSGPPDVVAGLIDRELFAQRCTGAMLESALELCADWRPDAVVRESCEYTTAVAARRAGLPQLQVGISQAAIEHAVLDNVAPVLAGFEAGLVAAIQSSPYLSSFPARLDQSPWRDTRRFRALPPPVRALPDWWPGDDRPLIYVTFGTVLGHLVEAHDVYRAVLQAVSDLPARVLVTVGRAIDSGALGQVSPNTHVEPWVAQHHVFAQARLVVCHGGSGTTFGALAAGLPLVICPLFADQTANAKLIANAGLGLVHHPVKRSAGGVGRLDPSDTAPLRHAILAVLTSSRYQDAARRLASEIAHTPTLDAVLSEWLDTVC